MKIKRYKDMSMLEIEGDVGLLMVWIFLLFPIFTILFYYNLGNITF